MKYLMSSIVMACCAAQAHALGGLADVRVVSRDTGAVLPAYFYRGDYWIAGNPGERYAIEIQNRLGSRLLAVTSVDGVNVVSGETAAWGQTGYVFAAGEAYRITGWRKSDAEVAAFSFTAAANSYAERTGRPQNIGVIGVALFEERTVEVATNVPQYGPPGYQGSDRGEPGAAAREKSSDSLAESSRRFGANALPAAPSLGTAHGPRESSYVGHTAFERKQLQPDEVIRIRYDSMANLVAMGVIRRQRQVQPNPFPDALPYRYTPDPPG